MIAATLLGLIIGAGAFLFTNRSNINFLSDTTHRPSTSTIESYLDQGDYQKAYEEALKYTSTHPNNPLSYKYLGSILFNLGRYEESNKNFELALQNKNLTLMEKAEIYYLMGRNSDYLRNYNQVLLYNQKALELNPKYSAPYHAIGLVLIKQKKYQEAIPFFEKTLAFMQNPETNPQAAYPYYYLAKIYFESKDYLKAKEMIDKAIKFAEGLNPTMANVFIQMIQSLKLNIEEQLIS